MFVAEDTITACKAAIAVREAVAKAGNLPPLRIGIAEGPVLRSHGDYFGSTVNIASKLCDEAPVGGVLVLAPEAVTAADWKAAGLRARNAGKITLRHLKEPVRALRIDGAVA
jgi:adenylate cyclase